MMLSLVFYLFFLQSSTIHWQQRYPILPALGQTRFHRRRKDVSLLLSESIFILAIGFRVAWGLVMVWLSFLSFLAVFSGQGPFQIEVDDDKDAGAIDAMVLASSLQIQHGAWWDLVQIFDFPPYLKLAAPCNIENMYIRFYRAIFKYMLVTICTQIHYAYG